ncbi:MAG: hypothetical protein A2284_18815 [Deltaproteobacteria bacterium RIFOXYA12_FULL_61_11]|nr:MAG: hypothetical protein A2284_18815 [Deltaproteobacteria bacterium RIFOXYA12_FULL_61_11]
MKPIVLWCWLMFLPTPLLSTPLMLDRIVAVVNGQVITGYELDQAIAAFGRTPQAAAIPAAEVRPRLLDELIVNKLIAAEVKKLGREVTEQDVLTAIRDIRMQNDLTEEELVLALRNEGKTFEEYKVEIKAQIERYQLTSYIVQQRARVSEEDLQRHYQERLAGETVQRVKLEHLRFTLGSSAPELNLDTLMGEARKLAASGVPFEQIPERLNSTAVAYGSFGDIALPDLNKIIASAIEGLRPPALSAPVPIAGSTFIFHLLERRTEAAKTFAEVKEELRQQLLQAQGEKHLQRWLNELKSKASIVYKDPTLQKR